MGPLSVLILSAAGSAIATIGKERVFHVVERAVKQALDTDDLRDYAIQAAGERLGLKLDPDNLTPDGITAAINNGPLAGSGLELENIFDRQAVKRDIGRVAVKYASDALGVRMPQSEDDLRELLKEWVTDELVRQLEAGGGPWIDAVKDVREIVEVIAAYRAYKEGGMPPVDMSHKAVKNRERQARYRATHRKVWVTR